MVGDSIGLECPYTEFSGCAACEYYGFAKLSNEWSILAYEEDETKHCISIKIYKKTLGKHKLIQTLYGYLDSIIVHSGNNIYSIITREDTCNYS